MNYRLLYLFARAAVECCEAIESGNKQRTKVTHGRYNKLQALMSEKERKKSLTIIGRINALRYSARMQLVKKQEQRAAYKASLMEQMSNA